MKTTKTDWAAMATKLGITTEEMAKNRAEIATANARKPTEIKTTIRSIQEAVLYGGTPAPEYQTRPDAWEIECEEENA